MKPMIYADAWYQSLAKSSLTPPPIVFMLVWPILYVCMFLAMFLAPHHKTRWFVFAGQLVLNILWQPLFFQQHRLGLSLLVLVILWLLNAFVLHTFAARSWSFYLYLPYVLWLTFAAYLMGYVWFFN